MYSNIYSVQFSRSVVSNSLWPYGLQHARFPCFTNSQLLELAQTHVHWVSNAIQHFTPLLSPSPPAFNLSQHWGLFQWVSSLHQVATVLEFQLQLTIYISSVAQSCPALCDPMNHSTPGLPIHHQLPDPNPYPSSQWWHPTTSSSVVLFSSCPQSFPASGLGSDKYYLIALMWGTKKSQIHRVRKYIGRCQGLGNRRWEGGMGTEFQFRKVKNLGDEWWWELHSSVNILSATELYS